MKKEKEMFECDACHRKFNTARSLNSHYRFCEVGTHVTKRMKKSKYKILDNLYKCECGKEFQKRQSLLAHFSFCLSHKKALGLPEVILPKKIKTGSECNFSKAYLGDDGFKQMKKKSTATLKSLYETGKLHGYFLGKKHTKEQIQKIRIGTIKYLQNVVGARPRYNKQSIPILEEIAKEHGWNIQHAENGGEFYTGIGYFVDAYDKEKNIVLEYDEPAHYVDVENNVLRKKDILRQQNIIEHLNCEYYRFNEATKQLWKV